MCATGRLKVSQTRNDKRQNLKKGAKNHSTKENMYICKEKKSENVLLLSTVKSTIKYCFIVLRLEFMYAWAQNIWKNLLLFPS